MQERFDLSFQTVALTNDEIWGVDLSGVVRSTAYNSPNREPPFPAAAPTTHEAPALDPASDIACSKTWCCWIHAKGDLVCRGDVPAMQIPVTREIASQGEVLKVYHP